MRAPAASLSLLVAPAFALLAGCSRRVDQAPPPPSMAKSDRTVVVRMSFGSEKEGLMRDAIRAFERNHPATSTGDAIHIEGTAEGSAESMEAILAGRSDATVWSPASSLLLDVLNDRWAESHAGRKLADSAASVARSPVVIGMWEPMARALGRPELNIGWGDLVKLSGAPDGWARFGHSEWGLFKLGHTHPRYSNSGLIALVAATYAGAGKTGDLTGSDVARASDFVKRLEGAVLHYGRSSGFFAEEMFMGGPSYLSAAVFYESDVVDSYLDPKYKNKAYPVVAVYPKDGTLWADHPYATLDLPATTSDIREAAEIFRKFLLSAERQQIALRRFGFRPADPAATLGPPIDPVHGVDPAEPRSVLPNPPVYVTRQVLETFQQVKRPVSITFAVDVSDSMAGDSLDQAKAALKSFLEALPPEDTARLMAFSAKPEWVFDKPQPLSESRKALLRAADSIAPGRGDSLYESVVEASRMSANQPRDARRAVIVFSDGKDNITRADLAALLNRLEGAGEVVRPRLFVVGCANANTTLLKQLAQAGSGRLYSASQQDIKAIFEELAAFF